MKISKKTVLIFFIILMIIVLVGFIIKICVNKDYKNEKIGNNKSIEEIEKYILNIRSYKANLSATIVNNRNQNEYTIMQEVKQDYEKQNILAPDEIKGLEMTYSNGKLEIKNTELNLSKIYENYPSLSENNLFLTQFIESYKNQEEKRITQFDENTILMEVKTDRNRYDVWTKLYVNKEKLKPEKLEVLENNNKIKVYILYNEIEINI